MQRRIQRTRWTCCLLALGVVSAEGLGPFESESARFHVEVFAENLKQPVALAFLPDGRLLVAARRSGSLHTLDVATKALTTVRDVPPMLTGGDAGLLDVELHPDDGSLYLAYSEGSRIHSTLVVDRARLLDDALVDRERVFSADAFSEDLLHYGGRLRFHDGHLYVTVGDRHHQDRAQERRDHTGTIVRLHADGRVPADNPFVGAPNVRPEIWSYGHRNPQGLAVHPGTGELWSHEHGPLAGDELNQIVRGGNYGWPRVSNGWEYAGGPIGRGVVAEEGTTAPVWVWSGTIAPSGMVFYSGERFPNWRGSLFTGALAGRHLNRLVLQDGKVVLEERLMLGSAGRIRAVAEGPDGLLYVADDDGRVLRLVPAP